MVKKLAIRSLRRGIGSMDYIHTLLIMEDDLDDDEDDGKNMDAFNDPGTSQHPLYQDNKHLDCKNSPSEPPSAGSELLATVPEWCKCGRCQQMPQDIENKCCKQKQCITYSSRFSKLCLDPDVLELCIRNASDIRNDREDNSTRAFRKAAYRQFILTRYGYLGKGNRRVCPSCVVLQIRKKFPSLTGIYMGYRKH